MNASRGLADLCGGGAFLRVVRSLFIHVSGQMQDECLRRGIGRRADHIVAESRMELNRFRYAARHAMLMSCWQVNQTRQALCGASLRLEKRKAIDGFCLRFGRWFPERPNTVLLLQARAKKDAIEHDIAELILRPHV